MFFDYSSLLLATGVTALAGGMTFILSWASDKTGGFLVSCGSAMLGVGISVCWFMYFSASGNILPGYFACATLIGALSVAIGSARQYQTGKFPLTGIVKLSTAVVVSLTIPFLFGLTGLGFAIANILATLLLAANAYLYWQSRSENPTIIRTISALYILCSLSFFTCAIMLVIETPLVLNGPPENWAESLNLLVSAITLTGIAALTIALNHQRLVHSHRRASETDPLTGLNNRRALFDKFGAQGLPADAAVILCDLDRFKLINDQYGHATGDEFLVVFSKICTSKLRPTDFAIRLGGEEFAIIVTDASSGLALATAESVRAAFERVKIISGEHIVSCTVSCGIYVNEAKEYGNLDVALGKADAALYEAKRQGRNLVHMSGQPVNEKDNGAALRSHAIAKVRKTANTV